MTTRRVPARPGRPRGPRRDRDERRAELLDAAERAIRRIGPHASMDEIAAEAGVTKPILYSHFGDKAGLVSALTARVAQHLNTTVGAALTREGNPRAVVASTIEAFCTFIERETELYRFLVQSALHQQGDKVGGSGPRLMSDIGNQIAVTLGAALRRAGADSGAAEPWAFAIVGMTFTGRAGGSSAVRCPSPTWSATSPNSCGRACPARAWAASTTGGRTPLPTPPRPGARRPATAVTSPRCRTAGPPRPTEHGPPSAASRCQASGSQEPWKPKGTRTGRWTVATGSPPKSRASRTTTSLRSVVAS